MKLQITGEATNSLIHQINAASQLIQTQNAITKIILNQKT